MAVPLHAKQAHRGSRGVAFCIFDLSTKRVGWSVPHPGHFISRKQTGTDCTGGWLGLRVGLGGSKSLASTSI